MSFAVPDNLNPIAEVLLGLFPWLNPHHTDDCYLFPNGKGFTLYPVHGTQVIVQITDESYENNKGILYLRPDNELAVYEFRLGDPIEAVGVVSLFKEQLTKNPPDWFKEPFAVCPPPGNPDDRLICLISPSRRCWKLYKKQTQGIWHCQIPWKPVLSTNLVALPYPPGFPGIPTCIGDLLMEQDP